MANYQTHTLVNLFLILPLTTWGLYALIHPTEKETALFIASFVYTTLFMSPDVDLAHQNKLFSLKGLLTFPFRLYSHLFSHRGLSHMPFIGTLTRILYLLALFSLSYLLIYQTLPSFSFIKEHQAFLLFGLYGAFLADLAHELLDFFH